MQNDEVVRVMSLEQMTIGQLTKVAADKTVPLAAAVENAVGHKREQDINLGREDDLDGAMSKFDLPGSEKSSLLRQIVVKIRLLPLVIFFCTLTLTVRMGDIWEGVDSVLNGTLSVSEAVAQTEPPAEPPAGAGGEPSLGGENTTDLMAGSDEEPLMLPEEDRAAIAARMLADDPTLLTQSEIDLLQKLAERRIEIDARASELEVRTAMLAAVETRIDGKIEEFKALQVTIENLVKEYDQQQSNKLLSLVKIYENMKPKDAARIFEELDMETLLQVSERMKERSLAPIMAKLAPERARELTVEMNQLRTMPEIPNTGG